LEEEAIDDFSEYFNGAAPKLLITTSSNAHGVSAANSLIYSIN
jgi:hypothetical protein